MATYNREAVIISVDGVESREGAPGLKFRFGDMQDGKITPFFLSNGTKVNPAPAMTLFRGQRGDVAQNERINNETLIRLGYIGDFKSPPTVGDFKAGATRPDVKPVEISWEPGEYGNEVKSVRPRGTNDGAAFFGQKNLKPKEDDRGQSEKNAGDNESDTNGGAT